jgi:DNA repair photolyase
MSQLIGIARLAASSSLLEEKKRAVYRELPTGRWIGRQRGERMPFEWTINPYRGCEFACRYCYARYTHVFMNLEASEFDDQIFVKQWDAAAFRRELRRVPERESIAIGTATDPWQPAERRFRLTRRMLEVISEERGLRVQMTTKSDLVASDAALLARASQHNDIRVYVTVTTLDTELARAMEPGAPRPDLRLRAVAELRTAGVSVAVTASPLLPGLNDEEADLLRLGEAAKAAGAVGFHAAPVFLSDTALPIFLPWLRAVRPELARKYATDFRQKWRLPENYTLEVREKMNRIRRSLGLVPGWGKGVVENKQPPSDGQSSFNFYL